MGHTATSDATMVNGYMMESGKTEERNGVCLGA